MNEAIEKQTELIDKIIILGRKIISDINIIGGIQLPNDKEDLQKAVILNYQKFYIENFFDFAEFLLEKIKNDEKKNFQYYIPLLRVFMEIYIDLLYLTNQSIECQAKLCVCNYLFTLAKYIQIGMGSSQVNSDELIGYYNETLKQDGALLDSIKIPLDPCKLSKEFMKKNNLLFPSKEIILNNYFINSTTITRNSFTKITEKNFYESYRTLSDYIHGTVFSLMKKDIPTLNEQFWLIARLEMFSMLTVELANKNIIQNGRSREFQEWIDEYKLNVRSFTDFWQSKSA